MKDQIDKLEEQVRKLEHRLSILIAFIDDHIIEVPEHIKYPDRE